MKIIAALALVVLLAACAGQAVRAKLDKSNEAYKACLAEKGPAGCEVERLSYEADLKQVEATRIVPRGSPATVPAGASGASFMCKDAMARGDSGAIRIFC